MNIEIPPHASEQMQLRGATENDVIQTIIEGNVVDAHSGRQAKEAVFDYRNLWRGKWYAQKLVRVIFVTGETVVTVVTVIVRFGQFKTNKDNDN